MGHQDTSSRKQQRTSSSSSTEQTFASSTLSDEDEEITTVLKVDLKKCVKDGLDKYKSIMDNFLESNPSVTDSVLLKYHTQNVKVIEQAMEKCYKGAATLETNNPKLVLSINYLITMGKSRLDTLTETQFRDIYLRKKHIQMNNIVRQVKEFTSLAQQLYDDFAEHYETIEKTKEEIKTSHYLWVGESVQLFEQQLGKNKFQNEDFWKHELESTLQQRYDEFVTENPFNTSTLLNPSYMTKSNPITVDDENSLTEENEENRLGSLEGQKVLPHGTLQQIPTKTQESHQLWANKSDEHSRNTKSQFSTSVGQSPCNNVIEPGAGPLTEVDENRLTEESRETLLTSLDQATLEGLLTLFGSLKQTSTKSRENQLPAKQFGEHAQETKNKLLVTPYFQTTFKSIVSSIVQEKTQTKIDLGIYLNQSTFKIGYFSAKDTTSKESPEILSVSPEIYFSKKQILVGEKAQTYRSKKSNYFNIFQLVTLFKLPEPMDICMHGQNFTVCAHQVIAAFLHDVLSCVHEAYEAVIGKIVVTVPFTPTFTAIETLRKSFKIAGFSDVHILSTLLTTTISITHKKDYYKKVLSKGEDILPKYALVLDCNENSFVIGIIKISMTGICVQEAYFSHNATDFEDQFGKYLEKHKHNNLPTLRILVSENLSQIEELVQKKLGHGLLKKEKISHGPLQGASLLAVADSSDIRSILPPSIKMFHPNHSELRLQIKGNASNFQETKIIQVNAPNDFLVEFEDSGSGWEWEYREAIYVPVHRDSKTILTFQLEEIVNIGSKTNNFEISRHSLALISDPSIEKDPTLNSREQIIVICSLDAYGVMSLRVENALGYPMDLEMVRLGNSACVGDCISKNLE